MAPLTRISRLSIAVSTAGNANRASASRPTAMLMPATVSAINLDAITRSGQRDESSG